MTHVERITAAIQRLEGLRGAVSNEVLQFMDAIAPSNALSDLDETLHRTVDAQLAILREAIPYAKSGCLFEDATELALADAILGDAS